MKYINRICKYLVIFVVALLLVLAGQINQAINATESVTEHFVNEWVNLSESNKQTLNNYNALCRRKITNESFSESIERGALLTHKECAEKANASELYSVIEKANSIIKLSWPLSEL